MSRVRVLAMALILAAGTAFAAEPAPDTSSITAPPESALTAVQINRYHGIIEQLRCLVCKNRSIGSSEAPLAADLRALVRRQIAAGRSDDQIKDYLVARYGQWVLYRPRFEPATWLLWLGPPLLLLIGLAAAALLWRRTRNRVDPPPPDPRSIEHLLDEEYGRQ